MNGLSNMSSGFNKKVHLFVEIIAKICFKKRFDNLQNYSKTRQVKSLIAEAVVIVLLFQMYTR